MKCVCIGYPHTRKQVIQSIAREKGIETMVSQGWWDRFRQHHSEVSLRIATPLSVARLMTDFLNNYFDLLEDTLKGNGIFDSASHIKL